MFKDVNSVVTDEFTQDNETMRKFVVECTLDPNAEVSPGENNKTAATEIQPK